MSDFKYAIEAIDLVKTYPPDVRALDGVSLSVPAGTIFALLGPNGAGKSTTVRTLTTLSPPDSGTARAAGGHPLPPGGRQRRGEVRRPPARPPPPPPRPGPRPRGRASTCSPSRC